MLEGYNGTVMAYGQTGTGKTYTVGRHGKDDPSESGIMVRALKDILSSMSFETDRLAISYLQVLFWTTNIVCLLTPYFSVVIRVHQYLCRIALAF